MEEMTLKSAIQVAQLSELTETDRQLIDMAIEGLTAPMPPTLTSVWVLLFSWPMAR